MTSEEILKSILNLLDQHFKDVRGYIGQEPYKGDLFKEFRNAYLSHCFEPSVKPKLEAGALRDIVDGRLIQALDENEQEKAIKILDNFIMMWREWKYAWDNYTQ